MKGLNVVVILLGVNLNFDCLCYVVEWIVFGEKNEVFFVVIIKEEKGSFK